MSSLGSVLNNTDLWHVEQGDSLDILQRLPDCSIDSVVIDPPAGIGFMGKPWDSFRGYAPRTAIGRDVVAKLETTKLPKKLRESLRAKVEAAVLEACEAAGPDALERVGGLEGAKIMALRAVAEQGLLTPWQVGFIAFMVDVHAEHLRVLKPGAYMISWALPRTQDLAGMALRLAGFDVVHAGVHLFGGGFPKSRRITLDPRFCQCDAAARSAASTGRGRSGDGRTGTASTSGGDGPRLEGARHSTGTGRDSQDGCPRAHGSNGGPPPLRPGAGQAWSPSQEGAQAHTRSLARDGARGAAQGRTPSRAQHSDRQTTPDSQARTCDPSDTPTRTTASKTGPSQTAKDTESPASNTGHNPGSREAYDGDLPRCTTCGKVAGWDGHGTMLAPGHEIWHVSRKPTPLTYAKNVLEHGCGAMNIDACRVPRGEAYQDGGAPEPGTRPGGFLNIGADSGTSTPSGTPSSGGSWPRDVLLSRGGEQCPVEGIDRQSGAARSAGHYPTTYNDSDGGYGGGVGAGAQGQGPLYADTGGASRFFTQFEDRVYYGPKASDRSVPGDEDKKANKHPTHKHPALMCWLVSLITPTAKATGGAPGVVLDSFNGSGTTGLGALLAESGPFRYIGLERNESHVANSRARLAEAERNPTHYDKVLKRGKYAKKKKRTPAIT